MVKPYKQPATPMPDTTRLPPKPNGDSPTGDTTVVPGRGAGNDPTAREPKLPKPKKATKKDTGVSFALGDRAKVKQ